jgi:hypothetical protein
VTATDKMLPVPWASDVEYGSTTLLGMAGKNDQPPYIRAASKIYIEADD